MEMDVFKAMEMRDKIIEKIKKLESVIRDINSYEYELSDEVAFLSKRKRGYDAQLEEFNVALESTPVYVKEAK